jgi:hypothetical protein
MEDASRKGEEEDIVRYGSGVEDYGVEALGDKDAQVNFAWLGDVL